MSARNLKVEMQAKFSQQTTTFKKLSKHNFDDLVRKLIQKRLIFSGKIDEMVRLLVTFSLN
jgi:hypothetical protein